MKTNLDDFVLVFIDGVTGERAVLSGYTPGIYLTLVLLSHSR